ncbi:MAG: hypothetical protein ABJE95_02005 [Byssovorax sp.]
MLSPSLSFRRRSFPGAPAPLFVAIFTLASTVAAQPAPPPPRLPPPSPGAAPAPERDPLDVVAPPPTAPMTSAPAPLPAPIYPPGPPAWSPQPQPWGAPQPQWGAPQPGPGAWPAFTPAPPLSPSFYRPETPFSLPPPVPKEAANSKLMTVGIVAAIGGVATLITGSILMSVAKERIDVYRDGPSYCCSIDDAPMRNAGITLLVVGGITATIGVPLWMIGGRRVPVRKTTTTEPPRTPASAAPVLRIGASRASLSWQF